jgi:type I restriction enzyme S subunit
MSWDMKDNWNTILIGKEVNLLGGFPFPSSKFNEVGIGSPLIRIRDLLKSSQETFFDGSFSKTYLIETGDILVGMDGDFHIVKWKNSASLLNQRILKIEGKKNGKIDTDFLFYFLIPFLEDIHNKTTATTVKHLSTFDISNAVESFPPLPQQRKIAHILTTCDAVIEKTEAAIAKYQAIKQGMMHDLFTRGIDLSTGKLRPKQEDAPELYKESELGWIPKEWETDELINLTKLVTDGSHFSPVPQEKGLPIGNVKDMLDSTFNYGGCTKILPEVFDLLVRQNCSPKVGDVLLSKDGTIGKVIHFEDDIQIVVLSSIAIIRVNELIDSRYLAWTLKSEYFDKALFGLLSGSALKRITLRDIQKIKVPFSKSINEQQEISKRLNNIESKLQSEQSTRSKYRQIKAGLMQDLLSGKVEVTF